MTNILISALNWLCVMMPLVKVSFRVDFIFCALSRLTSETRLDY